MRKAGVINRAAEANTNEQDWNPKGPGACPCCISIHVLYKDCFPTSVLAEADPISFFVFSLSLSFLSPVSSPGKWTL